MPMINSSLSDFYWLTNIHLCTVVVAIDNFVFAGIGFGVGELIICIYSLIYFLENWIKYLELEIK